MEADLKKLSWLFVTGTPRSGTTFVGKVLSMGLHVDYIHEPFNPDCGMQGITEPYTYYRVSDDGWKSQTDAIFDYSLKLRTGIYPTDGFLFRLAKRMVGSRGPFNLRIARMNLFRKACVIKDPIGCFQTAFLYSHYDVKPIIMLRHPVSFVGSMMKLGWPSHLNALWKNRELRKDYPDAFDGLQIEKPGNRVSEYAWLWRIIYSVLLRQRMETGGDWKLIRHEDLCVSPVEIFEELYVWSGLDWNDKIRERIQKMTGQRNRVEPKRVQDFYRDSRSLVSYQFERTTPEMREDIYRITSDVAIGFYEADSFKC